jgi:hypothetical protein
MNGHPVTHLCVILDKDTGKEITSYEIVVDGRFQDWYNARHIARARFEEEQKYKPNMRRYTNWAVDSVEL